MIAAVLLLIVAGIGLAQAVSDPRRVTLRWLRLGGMLAVTLGGVAMAATIVALAQEQNLPRSRHLDAGLIVVIVLLPFIIQLLTVQMGERTVQRVAAGAGFVLLGGVAWGAIGAMTAGSARIDRTTDLQLLPTAYLSAGLLGGFLMTMLLGHAYLTAGGEMTQAPFRRLVRMLAVLLLLRAAASAVFGLLPWLAATRTGPQTWPLVMVAARFGVGLLVPGVFTYMIHDCVSRRANQSATGILYVTTVLIIIGELAGLSLFDSTGKVF